MLKMRRYFKITSTMKVIFLIACIVAVCSCKKDYQKLGTEFERQLPDTIVVVKEQINDIDHHVYFKDKNNDYLVRYNLDDNMEESIKPNLEDGEYIQGYLFRERKYCFSGN